MTSFSPSRGLAWLLALWISLSAAPLSAQDLDPDAYYRLKTMWRGEGECLEGNAADNPPKNGAAFMDSCQDVSGQLWQIVPASNGYVRLKTMWRGEGECLEGNAADNPPKNGAAFMDTCQDVSGQLWQIVPASNGYVRLQTMWRGDGECFEGNAASNAVKGGAAFMDACQDVSGQLWQIVPAGTGRLTAAQKPLGTEAVTGCTAASSGSDAAYGPADIDCLERIAHDEANQARQANGLAPLAWSNALADVSRAFGQDQARRGYDGHYSPEGAGPRDRLDAAGIRCSGGPAENWATSNTVAQFWMDSQGKVVRETMHTRQEVGQKPIELWLDSPGHRRNLLNPAYSVHAIGFAYDEAEDMYRVVQMLCP